MMTPRLFTRVLHMDRWIRERFTPLGRMLLAASVAVGLFAMNPRATLAYQLAIILVSLVVAATMWAPWFRPRLRARRRLPRYATVGVPMRYTVELALAGGRGVDDIAVNEEPRRPTPAEAVADAAAELPPTRWPMLRHIGYARYVRAMRRLEGARCLPGTVDRLLPGRARDVAMELVPQRRGSLHLDRLRVTRTDPLGVFRARRRLAMSDRVLVLPARYPVKWSGNGATARQARRGTSRSRSTGAGADFARLREYRPRDSLRNIHWRAWARLGEPIVKEFHEESPSRNALVLDTSTPPGCARATFEEAVSVAASFVADPGWRNGRLDLLFAGADAVHLAQGAEGEGVARMLEALAGVDRTDADAFAALSQDVRAHVSAFGACVLVLLALDAPRRDLVRALGAAGVATLVLLVADDASDQVRAALRDGLSNVRAVVPGDAARVLASLESAAHAELAGG